MNCKIANFSCPTAHSANFIAVAGLGGRGDGSKVKESHFGSGSGFGSSHYYGVLNANEGQEGGSFAKSTMFVLCFKPRHKHTHTHTESLPFVFHPGNPVPHPLLKHPLNIHLLRDSHRLLCVSV